MRRAPFSTPPPCNQFLTLVKITLPFCFQCRRARSQYPKDPHQGGLRGPGACSFWSAPLHTYPILFVCLSCMPPHFVRCCLPPNFFFPRQLSKSTRRENFYPMVGGGALERGGKEGQDRLLIRNQPTVFFLKKIEFPEPTPLKTLSWPLCASE